MRKQKVVRLDSLSLEERAVVLALIAAQKAADETPAKVTDPVALKRLAGLIAPAMKRSRTVTEQTPVKVIRERRPHSPKIVLRSTPDIIETAIPADSGHCIWADALKEAVPNAKSISVDLQSIRFTDPDKGCRYTYLTPRSIQVDLVKFDQGFKPEPMAVMLRGAQVTKAGRKGKPQKRGVSVPTTTELVTDDGGNVLRRVGGTPPPIGALAHTGPYTHTGGKRRVFGLRGLGRVDEPAQP